MNIRTVVLAASAAFALTTAAEAGVIPYPNPGTLNPIVYSFSATGGNVIAYFGNSDAGATNVLGLRVGGVDYISSLNNKLSLPGDSFDFGSFAVGTKLTFFINSIGFGDHTFYSDPSLNDDGLNHVYSTAYTQGGGLAAVIPTGTYVGFEDLQGGGDRDYNDLTYVFTNVASGVPEPGTWAMMLLGLCGLGFAASRRQKAVPATA